MTVRVACCRENPVGHAAAEVKAQALAMPLDDCGGLDQPPLHSRSAATADKDRLTTGGRLGKAGPTEPLSAENG
jgi:hypothetical protein